MNWLRRIVKDEWVGLKYEFKENIDDERAIIIRFVTINGSVCKDLNVKSFDNQINDKRTIDPVYRLDAYRT